ncbi:MAG: hypothetical protein L3J41_04190 [Melioribacteraceae bacterium]|nr:hypothetical protein [Melioribacteraceae bacterium]
MKILLINIFLFNISIFIIAQTLDEQKHYADSLFGIENYYDAITEYKRLLYFDKLNNYKYDANLNIAEAYKVGAKYSDAIKHFTIVRNNCTDESGIINAELKIVRINILRRTIPEALRSLNNLQSNYAGVIETSVINYWRGWAYIMADNWDLASIEFAKIEYDHPLKIISDKVELEKYSITFAKMSSLIIPGAGQFYTGNYISGILSLGWNVLWGYLTINAFITERAVEGILIGGLLWARFYRGNFQNAEKFAIDENKKISNKAYKYLSKEYFGEKP